jgi:Putative F0F1-ATPase subunit Ca2+/Mg2+ transporter
MGELPSITEPEFDLPTASGVLVFVRGPRVSVVAVSGGVQRPGCGVPVLPAGKWGSQVAKQPEQRPAFAVGVEWASRVSTIAMAFSLPPLIGFGLDRWWTSGPIFTLLGVLLGFVGGLLEILRLARQIPGRSTAGAAGSKRDATAPEPHDSNHDK